jgi:hypothetical protein
VVIARLHVGHSFFIRNADLMQPSQKLCLHTVTTGAMNTSRHIGQHRKGALERTANRVGIYS